MRGLAAGRSLIRLRETAFAGASLVGCRVYKKSELKIMKKMGSVLDFSSMQGAPWLTKVPHLGKVQRGVLSPRLFGSLVGFLLCALALGGCAIIPGNDVYGMRMSGKSDVKLPVETAEGTVPANVTVRPITAELIIQKEKELRSAPQKPYVPPGHQDYRVAAGDIITIIVWDHPELTIPAGEFRSAESGRYRRSGRRHHLFPLRRGDQGPRADSAAGQTAPHREAQPHHRERPARGARRHLPQPARLRRWGGAQTRDHPRHGRSLDHGRGRQPGGRLHP